MLQYLPAVHTVPFKDGAVAWHCVHGTGTCTQHCLTPLHCFHCVHSTAHYTARARCTRHCLTCVYTASAVYTARPHCVYTASAARRRSAGWAARPRQRCRPRGGGKNTRDAAMSPPVVATRSPVFSADSWRIVGLLQYPPLDVFSLGLLAHGVLAGEMRSEDGGGSTVRPHQRDEASLWLHPQRFRMHELLVCARADSPRRPQSVIMPRIRIALALKR